MDIMKDELENDKDYILNIEGYGIFKSFDYSTAELKYPYFYTKIIYKNLYKGDTEINLKEYINNEEKKLIIVV